MGHPDRFFAFSERDNLASWRDERTGGRGRRVIEAALLQPTGGVVPRAVWCYRRLFATPASGCGVTDVHRNDWSGCLTVCR